MDVLLAFSVVLFVGVLFSGLAHRTVLSTAVLFLLAGVVLGEGAAGVLELAPDDELVIGLAELALFSVLYTDGMRVGFSDLRRAWRLPGRALVLGMPLTFAVTGALAHWPTGLPVSPGPRACSSEPFWHRPIRCSPRRSWAAARSPAGSAPC